MTDNPTLPEYPELRPIDMHPTVQEGRPVLYLRDPLQISDRAILLPQGLAPLLSLCDGTRSIGALRASLAVRYGLPLTEDVVVQVLTALDQACLLTNGAYQAAAAEALDDYRKAPHRPSMMAGVSYPSDADALREALDGYGEGLGEDTGDSLCRGLVSPHIDYDRGGAVYAAVWRRAQQAVREAELVVVLGTDHYGGLGRLTLTHQHYATPFGVLPTARDLVDELAGALGEEAVFAEELHHRSEHSIELSLVWCHHTREGAPCDVLPVLCGSITDLAGDERIAWETSVDRFVEVVRGAMNRRRTLVVASADLAHVGPAFGGQAVGFAERAQLKAADAALLERVCEGDAEGFLSDIRAVGNRHNVCGVAPIYLMLRLLGETQGLTVAYALCPADARGTSMVSVGGVVLG